VAVYRYLFADLLSGAVIAELPLSGVSFSRELNRAGSFSGSLSLGDPRLNQLDWQDALQEARTAVYAERDGVLLWGGILWKLRRHAGSGQVDLDAAEFWSYFGRRVITAAVAWSNVDQLSIAKSLIDTAQAATGGSLGVVTSSVSSGILRSLSYTPDQLQPVAGAVEDLSKLDSGFDFAIDLQYAGDPPAAQLALTLSYPYRGRSAANSQLVFDLPGNILGYDWPEDGSQFSTTVYAAGSGSGPSMLQASAVNSALLAFYPLLETVQSYKSLTDQATLNARAAGDLALLSQPVIPAQLTVRADSDPILGTYTVGDEARVLIQDQHFPQGLDQNFRITAMTVQPGEGGRYENVTLTLGHTVY
jgi:hypothetical protein